MYSLLHVVVQFVRALRNRPIAHCGSMICLYYYRKSDVNKLT